MFRVALLLFLLILFPTAVSYAGELNAGFVQGLWYGEKITVANKPTRVYVAFRNNTTHDLTGTIRFNDNGKQIGSALINALPGRIIEAWADWTPEYGKHSITATLTDVRIHAIGQSPETGMVENTIALDTIFVDYDTDADDIVNESDTDDDGDGVSDIDEHTRGTNPLKADIRVDAELKDPNDTIKSSHSLTSPKKFSNNNETIGEARTAPTNGLEQYVPNPLVHSMIQTVTETISETRESLDLYRKNRNDTLAPYISTTPTKSTTTTGNTATITRSKVTNTNEGFVESILHGGKALVNGIYSFILWGISRILAHPAILELVLLLFIMYSVYRIARRFGRRSTNNN